MRWRWGPLCIRPTCLVGFCLALAHWNKSADRHVAPLGHIIPNHHCSYSLTLHALVWPDRWLNPPFTTFEVSMLTITPLWYIRTRLITLPFITPQNNWNIVESGVKHNNTYHPTFHYYQTPQVPVYVAEQLGPSFGISGPASFEEKTSVMCHLLTIVYLCHYHRDTKIYNSSIFYIYIIVLINISKYLIFVIYLIALQCFV
jgi:hypothetical protein